MRRRIYSRGINDADYPVQWVDAFGKHQWCPFNNTWKAMLERCYSRKTQNKFPSYIGCKVPTTWLTFSNFKAWMETQDWEGKQLDKDILGDGKIYSPETCCFVPQWLNLILSSNAAKRGQYPIGVSYHKHVGRFASHVRRDGTLKHLGYFDTPEEAHKTYIRAKQKYVEGKMKNYPDSKVREAVLSKITQSD